MSEASPSPAVSTPPKEVAPRVFIYSVPKIIFLYPTFLVSIIAALVMTFNTAPLETTNTTCVVLTSLFLSVFAINMVVLSFDFPRTTSLTLFFFFAALIFGMFLTFQWKPELAGVLKSLFTAMHPLANATFFYLFGTIIGVIYLIVAFNLQFDYWEARPNEFIHHHGLWGDVDRYPTSNLRVTKEVNDLFEYLLLSSGRLILNASNTQTPIVLENVILIDRKEKALTEMLSALQVQVRSDNG